MNMKIGRFTDGQYQRIGLFGDEYVEDVTDSVGSFSDLLQRATEDEPLDLTGEQIPREQVEYLPPTTPSNSIYAAALNYRAHVDETGMEIPDRPLIFLKLYRSLVGHGQPIQNYVDVTSRLDYEAELAAVIGKPTRDIDADDALDNVAGYTILNDTSARDVQRMMVGDTERMDWFSGKAMQSTTPMGPWVVTSGDLGDPMNLQITSRVNGDLMQDDNTRLMIRDIAELVSFISTRVELEPGDVVATGTPEGVGEFQDLTLSDGDTVTIDVEDVGTLENVVEDRP